MNLPRNPWLGCLQLLTLRGLEADLVLLRDLVRQVLILSDHWQRPASHPDTAGPCNSFACRSSASEPRILTKKNADIERRA